MLWSRHTPFTLLGPCAGVVNPPCPPRHDSRIVMLCCVSKNDAKIVTVWGPREGSALGGARDPGRRCPGLMRRDRMDRATAPVVGMPSACPNGSASAGRAAPRGPVSRFGDLGSRRFRHRATPPSLASSFVSSAFVLAARRRKSMIYHTPSRSRRFGLDGTCRRGKRLGPGPPVQRAAPDPSTSGRRQRDTDPASFTRSRYDRRGRGRRPPNPRSSCPSCGLRPSCIPQMATKRSGRPRAPSVA